MVVKKPPPSSDYSPVETPPQAAPGLNQRRRLANDEQMDGHGSGETPASGPNNLGQTIAHELNNPLAALIANLALVAEAVDGDPPGADPREPLREAVASAERIRSVVSQLQVATPEPRTSRQEFGTAGPNTASRRRGARILIVDDDASVGRALARTLRGYDVVVEDDAREALARVVAGDRFELVLCDLMMPDMTGMDLYDEVMQRAADQAASFVFVTGGALTTRARDFMRTVPNLVLDKPFDVERIRELVRHREPQPEHVVLVVDDDEAARKMIVRWLTGAKFSCIEYASGTAAAQALFTDPDLADAVVLDVMMPGQDGFDVLAQLKANPETSHIPIILLTAQAVAESDVTRGIEAGAAFYLTKPFHGPALAAQVRATCERADAERELRKRLRSAEETATIDELTGLMNRRAFDGRLAEGMANTTRHHEPLALVMLDLDHFKQVNDTFGHAGGDRVLLYLARALRRAVRLGDQAFRHGGEEFALLLPKCDADGAMRVVTRIQRELRDRVVSVFEGKTVAVRFSAGIAAAEAKNGFRVEELVARADSALYRAKNAGRDRMELEE
jgi:two-component system cell cycle response regulator